MLRVREGCCTTADAGAGRSQAVKGESLSARVGGQRLSYGPVV